MQVKFHSAFGIKEKLKFQGTKSIFLRFLEDKWNIAEKEKSTTAC